jgi:tetratricopeptide (TPR) repeat protein
MMAENPRVDDLRRRVQNDAASIAFAQLAEEYRRGGMPDSAIAVCRVGLEFHPGYVSARVTLGRALLDLGQLDAAREELAAALASAPDNLAAARALAEIDQRQGTPAPTLADRTVAALERWLTALHVARAERLA